MERKKYALLALTGLLFSLALAYVFNSQPAIRQRSDLFPLWHATRAYLSEGRSLYSPQNASDMMELLEHAVDVHDGLFYYPAHMLVFTLPLAWLPFETAHYLWAVAGLWMFFAGTWLVLAALPWPRAANARTLLLALGTLSIPVLQHSIWTQFNTIAVLALGGCYWALRRGHYALAGALAAGLTFKPQASLAPLLFLALWALLRRERWRLLAGLAASGLTLWLFASWLQPGWLTGFLSTASVYLNSPKYPIMAVVDWVWNPHQLISLALLASLAYLTLRWRAAQPGQARFEALLAYSLAVGWLALPILGMVHLVAAPIAVALVCSAASHFSHAATRKMVWLFASLYALGVGVFAFGLSTHYGTHIHLSEIIYKGLLPLALALCSAWLLHTLPVHSKARNL